MSGYGEAATQRAGLYENDFGYSFYPQHDEDEQTGEEHGDSNDNKS